jgi:hypothetical protein
MKSKQLIFSSLLMASIAIISCTTNCPDPEPSTVNITNTVWTMHYFEGTSGNDVFYAAPTFIKNGVATYPATLPHGRLWFAEYSLPVPPEINLNLDTDSVRMVTNVKNPTGDGTAFEIDLGLSNDSKGAFASFQKGASAAFCFLGAGSQQATNVTEHLIDPTNFAELTLSIQNNTVNSFRNGTLLKTFNYTGSSTAGGRLNLVTVSFRGYGTVDWIKLYKGSKLIMSEDFDTDGKTTAVWTMP